MSSIRPQSPTGTLAEQAPISDGSRPNIPRKRRRRAPVTGATEDCFTCRRRKVKCDRRRPYCTQCIDMGKDCSGYRTTLTWGVGVASRGKLRGMSLPVARKADTPCNEPKPKVSPPQKSVTSTPARTPASSRLRSPAARLSPTAMSSPAQSTAGYDFIGMSSSSPVSIPHSSPPVRWHVPGFHEHLQNYTACMGKLDRLGQLSARPMHRVQTSLGSSFDDTYSLSTGTLSNFSDSDYGSPVEYSRTPEEMPFADGLLPPFDNSYLHTSQPSSMANMENFQYSTAPRSFPFIEDNVGTILSTDHPKHDYSSSPTGPVSSSGTPALSEIYYNNGILSTQSCGPSMHFAYPGRVDDQQQEGLRRDNTSMTSHLSNALSKSSPISPLRTSYCYLSFTS